MFGNRKGIDHFAINFLYDKSEDSSCNCGKEDCRVALINKKINVKGIQRQNCSMMEDLLKTGERADVTFYAGVGCDRCAFKAHKFILFQRIPGFEDCFKQLEEDHIRDQIFQQVKKAPGSPATDITPLDYVTISVIEKEITPETMKNYLNFIYLQEFCYDLQTESLIYLHNFQEDMQPVGMKNICAEMLNSRIHVENSLRIFDIAGHWKVSSNIKNTVLKFILEHGRVILKSQGLLDLSESALMDIISRNNLNCQEIYIFQALLRWTKRRFRLQNSSNNFCISPAAVEPSPAILRKIMEKPIQSIRFTLFSEETFNEQVLTTNLLTPEEIISIQGVYLTNKSDIAGTCIFTTTPRILTGHNSRQKSKSKDVPKKLVVRLERLDDQVIQQWSRSNPKTLEENNANDGQDNENMMELMDVDVLDVASNHTVDLSDTSDNDSNFHLPARSRASASTDEDYSPKKRQVTTRRKRKTHRKKRQNQSKRRYNKNQKLDTSNED